MKKVNIMAEVASAHQGDFNTLKTLIKKASLSGADSIKFQWFKYDHFATPDYEGYQIYLDLFFTEDEWKEAIEFAKSLNLEVWIDVLDDWGLNLVHKYKDLIDGIKLPATIIQSSSLIDGIANLNKPILVGVGGWYDDEIDKVVSLIKGKIKTKIILMHGFQGYPTKLIDANLCRIKYLKDRYNLEVGFADHEDAESHLAIDLPIYAYFSGATIIEKHLTLDRKAKGYDYYSSLTPLEFKEMVQKLKNAEIALGDGSISLDQRKYLKAALRVVAKENIKKGEIITLDKVSFKRCANENALMPRELEELLPRVVDKDISPNEPITADLLVKPKVTVAVICRLKSTRLPKKALLPIYGIPSIKRCLINCLAIPNVHHVVLATSDLSSDDPLEEFALKGKVKVVRGDSENVALRILKAADETDANIVLRVTGDCPLASPEIISDLIKNHLSKGADFTCSVNCPLGMGADVITVESLKRLTNFPKKLTHTEYLSYYFLNNPSLFKVNQVFLTKEYQFPTWRLTLDEKKDLLMFEALYSGLDVKEEPLYFETIKNYLEENPEIIKINSDVSLKWKDNKSLVQEIKEATKLNIEEA